mmetsp:Transcript_18772/g.59520  ORF Transcript_18772/g.59520 Transcript_18772/m.59520 type:complete len:320 (+) Transcript_18772:3604-4563(+)
MRPHASVTCSSSTRFSYSNCAADSSTTRSWYAKSRKPMRRGMNMEQQSMAGLRRSVVTFLSAVARQGRALDGSSGWTPGLELAMSSPAVDTPTSALRRRAPPTSPPSLGPRDASTAPAEPSAPCSTDTRAEELDAARGGVRGGGRAANSPWLAKVCCVPPACVPRYSLPPGARAGGLPRLGGGLGGAPSEPPWLGVESDALLTTLVSVLSRGPSLAASAGGGARAGSGERSLCTRSKGRGEKRRLGKCATACGSKVPKGPPSTAGALSATSARRSSWLVSARRLMNTSSSVDRVMIQSVRRGSFLPRLLKKRFFCRLSM